MKNSLFLLIVLVVVSTAISKCDLDSSGSCNERPGYTLCGYCAEDVMTSNSPNAGQCVYCPIPYQCYGDPCWIEECLPLSEYSDSGDLARNGTKEGFPNPLESDPGWGGGNDPWEIIDGIRNYPEWAHGLAFTGGSEGYGGESCGWRKAIVNFGQPVTFNRVVVWHHGREHIPTTFKVKYWDGTNWVEIFSTNEGEKYIKYPYTGNDRAWWETNSIPTEVTFPAVTSEKVMFELNNCNITHGWIYELEVYHDT